MEHEERTISQPEAERGLSEDVLSTYFARQKPPPQPPLSSDSQPNGRGKRTFEELRLRILLCLETGNRTINDLAVRSGINWRTVELHLTHLLGKKLVEEIFSSEYVRIFTITQKGRESLQQTKQRILQELVGVSTEGQGVQR